jgi:competence ComEA-like helix-hairpin-helix protein
MKATAWIGKETIMAIRAKLDVNEASKEDLLQIPGITEMEADAIIDFRESQGRLDNIYELAEVEEINPSDISTLREWLTAGEEEEEEEEEIEEGEEGEEEEEEW